MEAVAEYVTSNSNGDGAAEDVQALAERSAAALARLEEEYHEAQVARDAAKADLLRLTGEIAQARLALDLGDSGDRRDLDRAQAQHEATAALIVEIEAQLEDLQQRISAVKTHVERRQFAADVAAYEALSVQDEKLRRGYGRAFALLCEALYAVRQHNARKAALEQRIRAGARAAGAPLPVLGEIELPPLDARAVVSNHGAEARAYVRRIYGLAK